MICAWAACSSEATASPAVAAADSLGVQVETIISAALLRSVRAVSAMFFASVSHSSTVRTKVSSWVLSLRG